MSASQASQPALAAENNSLVFASVICPSCGHAGLNNYPDEPKLACSNCSKTYPLIQNGKHQIPWLLEHPNLMLAEWQARLNGFLHINESEQRRLKEVLKDNQVLNILAPLNLPFTEQTIQNNLQETFQAKVPKVQGLLSYYDNIFRDWSWDNGEHEELFKSVESILEKNDSLGKILTLGSGAGRLSYDLHINYKPELSMLVDINPLLLLASSSIIQGECLNLPEFPIAPINKDSFVALQRCNAPNSIDEGIHFLFVDAMNPSFPAKSFDSVLSPWLIDIVPQNLREFIPRINQILKIGGRWLNSGSLAFLHKDLAMTYSEEEVIELLVKNGFKVIVHNRRKISYLNSPLSAHGRIEEVFNFSAEKIKDVSIPKKYEYLPSWAKDISKAVPKSYDVEIESSKYLLQAQVLGAINGERSIEELGNLVAKQYSLDAKEAIAAVRRIIIDNYESNIN